VPADCYILNPGETKLTLREIKNRLDKAYCSNIGVEFMHLSNKDEKEWLKQKFETQQEFCTKREKRKLLARLVRYNFQVHSLFF